MISPELQAAVDSYENYISVDGIDEQVIDAYAMACSTCIQREKDIQYGLKLTARTKSLIEQFVFKQTEGMSMWDLEKYCFAHGTSAEILEKYYSILLLEAQNMVLDSYFQYLERKRIPKDRFYMPKRKQFLKIGVIQALQDIIDDKLDILCISLPPGTGKAQPLYSKVLTPDGFAEMGSLRVGDKVVAGNGNTANVIGVYPQGKKPIYEVTFDDGSKCRCSDEHLWTVQTILDRKKGRYRTIQTKDMLGHYMQGNNRIYSVDYVPKFDFPERKLLIDPYVLGVLLADGCFARKNIGFATPDKDIVEKVRHLLPEEFDVVQHAEYNYGIRANGEVGRGHKNKLRLALEHYGLFGHYGDTKFIPKDYMYASYGQRLELLRGLLDSDGSVGKRGYDIEYTSTSRELAENVRELAHSLGAYASISCRKAADEYSDHYRRLDSYRIVIEFPEGSANPFFTKRKADRFKHKRRGCKRFIANFEYVGEEECQCIMIDDPCHLYITDDYIITHNTTLSKFFVSGVIGWFKKDYNLFFSHSSDIARMYYDGVNDILTNADEYAWHDVFQGLKVTSTNAKMQTINCGSYKPFASLQCTSRSSNNAGVVRASKFLLVDDLVAGIEEALNKNIMDKLWNIYTVDARQRKIDGCKEIIINTRWSVHDLEGHLQQMYPESDRVRYISVPDIDPVTGESNFDYEFDGFSVDFFHDQELLMDDISYRCLYKQEPIEREGLLYHEDELRRYLTLPEREPDAILGVCDTKSKGTDYMVLPCVYQYGDDFYLVDCVCDDDSDFGKQEDKVTNLILRHNMQQCQFESNVGGDRFAANVSKKVQEAGGRCNITTKPTETNKETKIIVNADWVKKHILFPSKELYTPKSDMGVFIAQLLSYSVAGKVPHDDVPDAMAMFALYVTAGARMAKVEAVMNPFRRY